MSAPSGTISSDTAIAYADQKYPSNNWSVSEKITVYKAQKYSQGWGSVQAGFPGWSQYNADLMATSTAAQNLTKDWQWNGSNAYNAPSVPAPQTPATPTSPAPTTTPAVIGTDPLWFILAGALILGTLIIGGSS
jgi:hypothetical protein